MIRTVHFLKLVENIKQELVKTIGWIKQVAEYKPQLILHHLFFLSKEKKIVFWEAEAYTSERLESHGGKMDVHKPDNPLERAFFLAQLCVAPITFMFNETKFTIIK